MEYCAQQKPKSLVLQSNYARVAWVRSTGNEPGMGLEFVDSDAKLIERLGKVIARLDRS